MRTLRDDRGIALVLALGIMLTFAIVITGVIEYTSSNSRSSSIGHSQQSANQVAESGVVQAYSILNYWDWTVNPPSGAGNVASDPTLLGCTTGSAGASDCSSPTKKCVPVLASCTGASEGKPGTAWVFGIYGGQNGLTFYGTGAPSSGISVPAATWWIISTGYARNPTGAATLSKQVQATTTIYNDTNVPPNTAAWNHVYSTAPQGSGCELDVNGQNVIIDIPVYVTGDMCLSGNGAHVIEDLVHGQAVDLRVQGVLVLSGNSSYVGHLGTATGDITSGVVGGGCTKTVGGTTASCTNGSYDYHVRATSALSSLLPPQPDANAYNVADPGPKHICKSGTSPAPPSSGNPFESSGSTTQNNSAPTFDLTPASSYSCKSNTAGSSGELTWVWNSTTSTGTMTVNGEIFFDGPLQVTRSGTYSGKGTIYTAGTISWPNQTTNLCANATCDFNSWDPNANMLMFISLASSGNAITFTGNTDNFQGGLFAQPGATVYFRGNSINLQGPIVGGKYDWGNNVTIKPLPTITNLPPGAPLGLNVHATPGPLVYKTG
jgi:Tfp pilus assembly protein PilX